MPALSAIVVEMAVEVAVCMLAMAVVPRGCLRPTWWYHHRLRGSASALVVDDAVGGGAAQVPHCFSLADGNERAKTSALHCQLATEGSNREEEEVNRGYGMVVIPYCKGRWCSSQSARRVCACDEHIYSEACKQHISYEHIFFSIHIIHIHIYFHIYHTQSTVDLRGKNDSFRSSSTKTGSVGSTNLSCRPTVVLFVRGVFPSLLC